MTTPDTETGHVRTAPNGCHGHCCVAFELTTGRNYEQLQAAQDREGSVVAQMLVPLAHKEAEERTRKYGHLGPDEPLYEVNAEGKTVQWFKCKHWNETTRLCGIYEHRPRMCSRYPYRGQPCDYRGCSFRNPEPDENAELYSESETAPQMEA